MSGADNQVEERILAFFNHVTDPAKIVDRIKDDPAFGTSSAKAYGIRLPLAKRIIEKRDSLGHFESVEQIAKITGIGKDTLHDIY